MIYGIGVDIIENIRIKKAIDHFGEKFLNRIFSPQEIIYCSKKTNPFPYYAVRFSAKEAFLKALGTGLRGDISLNNIEVVKDKHGRPYLNQNKNIEEIFLKRKIKNCYLTLSHTEKYSVAYVILEK